MKWAVANTPYHYPIPIACYHAPFYANTIILQPFAFSQRPFKAHTNYSTQNMCVLFLASSTVKFSHIAGYTVWVPESCNTIVELSDKPNPYWMVCRKVGGLFSHGTPGDKVVRNGPIVWTSMCSIVLLTRCYSQDPTLYACWEMEISW